MHMNRSIVGESEWLWIAGIAAPSVLISDFTSWYSYNFVDKRVHPLFS